MEILLATQGIRAPWGYPFLLKYSRAEIVSAQEQHGNILLSLSIFMHTDCQKSVPQDWGKDDLLFNCECITIQFTHKRPRQNIDVEQYPDSICHLLKLDSLCSLSDISFVKLRIHWLGCELHLSFRMIMCLFFVINAYDKFM